MTKFNLDEGVKMFYKLMLNIDPDECREIKADFNKKSINLGDKKQVLEDFLRENTRLVSMDIFSTKEMNEKALERLPENERERYKALYFDMTRNWGLIQYESKPVGIINKTKLYNGYPNLVNNNELIKDPSKTVDRFYKNIIPLLKSMSSPPLIMNLDNIFGEPKVYTSTKLALHKDFLKEHPLENTKNNYLWKMIKGFGVN